MKEIISTTPGPNCKKVKNVISHGGSDGHQSRESCTCSWDFDQLEPKK